MWLWWWNIGKKLGCHQLPERSFLGKDINFQYAHAAQESILVNC